MTSKQTGDALKNGYGVGWLKNGMTFSHGGALAANMTIDPVVGQFDSTDFRNLRDFGSLGLD